MPEEDQGNHEGQWVHDDSLDAQLAHAIGSWIGMAKTFQIQTLPPSPASKEPLILLKLTLNPRNEGAPPIEQQCVFPVDGAKVLADKLSEEAQRAQTENK